mmetsp:Transcript_8436/g.22534  ORF Transcript_8436/g.22534 Transcript_8436/m.22534 type:complete len:126 (-) Transcript_8436:1485-1862(-)
MQLLAQQQAHAAETARYKQVVSRLKRLLEMERSSLRNVRMAHLAEATEKSELESLLRQSVEDVRREVARRRRQIPDKGALTSSGGRDVPISEFTVEDRERVMELLLSQERVLLLLYDKTFPKSRE